MRLVVVALAGAFGLATVPADAAAPTPRREQPARKKAKAKGKGKGKGKAKAKAAKHRKSKRERAKKQRKRMSAKRRVRVKTTDKPLVKVATLQSDGRVKLGPDRMPPGFAWPPTTQMRAAGQACEQALDELGVAWRPAARQGMVPAPVVVPAMEIGGITYTSIYKRAPHTMDCQFAHALAALGPELRALGVREIQFGSIYRNTMARSHGQTKAFLSRHALGIAMDIKSFVDDSGRVVSVEMDYLKDDPLLHGIEDTINRNTRFRQVLTPGNDPISHYDHFHIEAAVDFTSFR